MAEKTNTSPTEDKAAFILAKLAQGRTRTQVAAEIGYKDYRSLHSYMTRHGYSWDQKRKRYSIDSKSQLPGRKAVQGDNMEKQAAGRAAKIIVLIEQGIDPKEVSSQLEFTRYQDMAGFMTAQGYRWDPEKHNYIKDSTAPQQPENMPSPKSRADRKETKKAVPNSGRSMVKGAFEEYLSTLEWLLANKDRIERSLHAFEEPGPKLPQYTIPGSSIQHSLKVSHSLAEVVQEFSEEKKVDIDIIVQSAVIEYLRRYGYEKKIERLVH